MSVPASRPLEVARVACVLLVTAIPASLASAPKPSPAAVGKASLSLTLPLQRVVVGSKPVIDVRVQNVGRTLLAFVGHLRLEENWDCSLTRAGVRLKHAPTVSIDYESPTITSLVTLHGGAYYGYHVPLGDPVLPFVLDKPGRYVLACTFKDLAPIEVLLANTQRRCKWPKSHAAACARELTFWDGSVQVHGIETIRASVEFEVIRQ